MQPELSERVATVLELGSRDICLACVKIGIVSHWKVAVISYSNSSMQPELSERAASVADSGSTVVFFSDRFTYACTVPVWKTSRRTHTHTHRAAAMIDCLTWKDYWNTTETDDVNKATDSCQFPRHKPLFGCGSKDVKGLETFVLLCFFCAPVGFRKNGVQFVRRSESYCVSSCICWRHQELFVLIPAQALW